MFDLGNLSVVTAFLVFTVFHMLEIRVDDSDGLNLVLLRVSLAVVAVVAAAIFVVMARKH